jgi:hypothetical protein
LLCFFHDQLSLLRVYYALAQKSQQEK